MTDVDQSIERIEALAESIGLAELARRADVPYTTLADLRAKGWRPKSLRIFERLLAAANAQPSDPARSAEVAA